MTEQVAERRCAEAALQRRLKLEKTVSSVSSRFAGGANVDDAILASLADMGLLTKASHVRLFLFREGGVVADNTHEYCAPGVSPPAENLQNLACDSFPWLTSRLRRGETIHIADVSQMPPAAKAEQEALVNQGVKSLLALPLKAVGELAGFISLDNVEAAGEWEEPDIALLRVCSDIIGNSLARRKAGDSPRSSEGRFRWLAENAPHILFRYEVKPKRGFSYVSPAASMMVGYRPQEFYADPDLAGRLVHPEDRPLHDAATAGRLAGTYTCRWIHRDGRTVWAEVVVVPIPDPAGDTAALEGIVRDISERKLLEDQLTRARRLETAGYLAAELAHDFRNLLVPLAGVPEVIRLQLPEGHPAREMCDTMLEAVKELSGIIDGLLAVGSNAELQLEPLDFNLVVRQALQQLVNRTQYLIVDLHLASRPLPVKGSPLQLLRLVNNLVSNAREAMRDTGCLGIRTEYLSGDALPSAIDTTETDEYVRLSVSDTGSGIPPEIMQDIFDPFFTTKHADEKPGTGLGLSIVRAIVADHRGYLDVESQAAKGTTFKVYLPVTRDPVIPRLGGSLSRGDETVLVVAEDWRQRTMVGQMLRALGYRVDVAAGGEEALDYLKDSPPDVVLLDMAVSFGGIGGIETHRQIKQTRPGQKVIALSGDCGSGQVEEVMGIGTCLRKPLSLFQLAQAVRAELDGDC